MQDVGVRLDALTNVLPPWPFTADEFLNYAIGLNVVRNANEVGSLLEQLVERGTIRQLEHTPVATWLAS